MRRLDYLNQMTKELKEAQEIIDRAKGNLEHVLGGYPIDKIETCAAMAVRAEEALWELDAELGTLEYGKLNVEVDKTLGELGEHAAKEEGLGPDGLPAENDNVPAGCECPYCQEAREDHLEIEGDEETVNCCHCGGKFSIGSGRAAKIRPGKDFSPFS